MIARIAPVWFGDPVVLLAAGVALGVAAAELGAVVEAGVVAGVLVAAVCGADEALDVVGLGREVEPETGPPPPGGCSDFGVG